MPRFPAKATQLVIVLALTLVLAGDLARAQSKSLAEEEITTLLKLGLEDETVVGRIQKVGISFVADTAALDRLKAAGASDAVVKALQEAGKAKRPAAPGQAITYQDVLKLVQLGVEEPAILARLAKSPTLFTLDANQIKELKGAGASDALLAAMAGQRKKDEQTGDVTDFAILLDCSGSMMEQTPDGKTKMVVAKQVVADLVRKVPDGLRLSFIIYGHDKNQPCAAVKIVRPMSVIDAAGKAELVRFIEGLEPVGATPIALALRTSQQEITRNNANCGLVLVSDGKESCKGDPAAEAAELAKNEKLTFGVNVVGFDVKDDERAALEQIARAGRGKYHNAQTSAQLVASIADIVDNLVEKAKPPEKVVSRRRAVKVLKPAIEFPECKEILLMVDNGANYPTAGRGKLGEEIRVPSATQKYLIGWVPVAGRGDQFRVVTIVSDFILAEPKVVEIKPEEHLGMIRVRGEGAPPDNISVHDETTVFQNCRAECKAFNEIMVVPAGRYTISIGADTIETGLQVEAGKLYELE